MPSYTQGLAIFLELEEAIRRIERRFSKIQSPVDFLKDDEGLDALDGISMILIKKENPSLSPLTCFCNH